MSPVPGSDSTPPTGPRVRLTYDDFVHFPDDGMRHELIDGEHYVTPAPSWKHQTVIGNISPVVLSVSPPTSPVAGGTQMYVTGNWFQPGATVRGKWNLPHWWKGTVSPSPCGTIAPLRLARSS